MKTVELSEYRLLDELDYNGLGIVQMTDHSAGERTLILVPRKEFEKHHSGVCVCPTYEMVAEWLRDKYDLDIVISPEVEDGRKKGYIWRIPHHELVKEVENSYDDALRKGVITALKLLKKNN